MMYVRITLTLVAAVDVELDRGVSHLWRSRRQRETLELSSDLVVRRVAHIRVLEVEQGDAERGRKAPLKLK